MFPQFVVGAKATFTSKLNVTLCERKGSYEFTFEIDIYIMHLFTISVMIMIYNHIALSYLHKYSIYK